VIACAAAFAAGGRRMLPAALVALALLGSLPLVAPGVVHSVREQFSASNLSAQESIAGRTDDYPAVVPDLRHGALLGRGFGSYAAKRYRFIDNQYLVQAIETGGIGLLLYLGLILTALGRALRLARRSQGTRRWLGAAGVGGVLAFLVANALFDALAFPHAPYAFLLLVALLGVARDIPDTGVANVDVMNTTLVPLIVEEATARR
jgi:cell division protein FtsW (lipid II flippase)